MKDLGAGLSAHDRLAWSLSSTPYRSYQTKHSPLDRKTYYFVLNILA